MQLGKSGNSMEFYDGIFRPENCKEKRNLLLLLKKEKTEKRQVAEM